MRKPRFGEYYIADVSWRPSNPIHRVIAVCKGDSGIFSLFSDGYESVRNVNPSEDLHYFKLVKRIAVHSSCDMPPEQRTIEEWL